MATFEEKFKNLSFNEKDNEFEKKFKELDKLEELERKMFILFLIAMLKSKKASNELILALLYIFL